MFFTHIFSRKVRQETTLRNFIFGVEDSLVSTVGLLAGVAAADVPRASIILTGLVLIVVEGLSMGVGSFLTEETTGEMAGHKPETGKAVRGALIMFSSYCVAGLIPLAPYTFFPGSVAVTISIIASLVGLFLLGFLTSLYFEKPKPWLRGLKMFVLGGLAVLAGMLIGKLFHL